MKYIIRIKCVSECMGIRRAALCYAEDKIQSLDFSALPHPLKKFKGVVYGNHKMSWNGETKELSIGEEVFFNKTETVDTGSGKETQVVVLGAMLIPLDREMEPYYVKQIEDGYLFDQWNGEFEYLLGLMYELDLKDDVKASEWYEKASAKRFTFGLIRDVM